MRGKVHVNELPLEARRKLGLRKSAEDRFPIEEVRREALAVLAGIRHLTAAQRRRVLDHAVRVNKV